MCCLVGSDFGDKRIDIHTTTCAVEANLACNECPDCIVTTKSDIATWKKLGAALTDDDVAGIDALVAELFHTEALADTIASVLDGSLSFLWAMVVGY